MGRTGTNPAAPAAAIQANATAPVVPDIQAQPAADTAPTGPAPSTEIDAPDEGSAPVVTESTQPHVAPAAATEGDDEDDDEDLPAPSVPEQKVKIVRKGVVMHVEESRLKALEVLGWKRSAR